jgi:hypothetical protein
MVKTADGKQTMVMMDAKTKITQGATKARRQGAEGRRPGRRVRPEDKGMILG